MSVYYYRLFKKLDELNISQNELMLQIKASSATMTKMRNNQIVSLDVLIRICDVLKCDIGDIVSCVSEKPEGTESKFDELNDISRKVLLNYMSENNLSNKDISSLTSLSLNTIKSFLSGSNISSASHVKLMRIGEQYNDMLNAALKKEYPKNEPQKRIYCYTCGKRGNKCWAIHTVLNSKTKKFDTYCAFGFKLGYNEGKPFALDECPHPTTGKEFASAKEKYQFKILGKNEIISGKGGK